MSRAIVISSIIVACAAAARRFLPAGPLDHIIRTRTGLCLSGAGLLVCARGLWELAGSEGGDASPWFLVGAAIIVGAALAADVGGALLAILFGVWPTVLAVVLLQLLIGPGDGPGQGWFVVAGICVILPLSAVIGSRIDDI